MSVTNRGSRRAALGIAVLVTATGAPASDSRIELSGGYTGVLQSASDRRVHPDATGSADLFVTVFPGKGRLSVYLEGNTSLNDDAVSSVLVESNADAGTALDLDRTGRVQVSELKYSLDAGAGSITMGLLDPSAYLDVTRINNDENQQFLGASFVNNPTIEFPDYTLGVVWERPGKGARPGLATLAASSHGISDNPNLSYGQLFNVDEGHKGVFLGVEVVWSREDRLLKAGGWTSTASHETLDGHPKGEPNYGIYGAFGRSFGRAAVNLRVGVANPEVSLGSAFAAASFQFDWGRRVLGIGFANTRVSHEADGSGLGASRHFETYLRVEALPGLYVTPSLQLLVHSGFDASGTLHDERVVVGGLRLRHTF